MKKLILIPIFLLLSCNVKENNHFKHKFKYKKGDITYLKLDSTKVMISRICTTIDEPTYVVYCVDKEGHYQVEYVEEFLLIDKK
jgi:hypothetical protein